MTSQTNKTSQETILLVDDATEILDVLGRVLRPHHQVKFATNGIDALALAQRSPPSLILLDVMMADLDGHEVCRRLKADLRTRDIPIIFITASDSTEDEQRGLDLGAVDYLRKPLNPALVLRRVAIHLALHNQNRVLDARVRERTRQLEDTRREIVRRLALAGEYRDNETGLHITRMSHTVRLLALAAGVPVHEAELLHQAAPMHDIGKIGIPDRILLKPGRLGPDEMAIMKTHTNIGAEIIGRHDSRLLSMPGKSPSRTMKNGMAAAIPTVWPAKRFPWKGVSQPSLMSTTPSPACVPTNEPGRRKKPSLTSGTRRGPISIPG